MFLPTKNEKKTHIHFGIPHSGYQEFSDFMKDEMLSSTYVDDVDLLELLIPTGDVFIFMVHDRKLCAWVHTLENHSHKDRAQQVHMFDKTLKSYAFDPKLYKDVLKQNFEITVPTTPIGGIFFTRTRSKKIIMVLNWADLGHNLPIVEFVLNIKIDRWKFSSIRYHKTKNERAARAMLKNEK